jgi:hypothetical protein
MAWNVLNVLASEEGFCSVKLSGIWWATAKVRFCVKVLLVLSLIRLTLTCLGNETDRSSADHNWLLNTEQQ